MESTHPIGLPSEEPTLREDAPCVLCGSKSTEPALTGYDRSVARAEDFPYVRCGGCGLLRLDPLPAPERIPSFYPDDYAPHERPKSLRRDRLLNRLAIDHLYAVDRSRSSPLGRALLRPLRGRVLARVLEPRGANRLLDVGCGAGGMLLAHRELGWDVRGVELSPAACGHARDAGLEVHCGTLFDAPDDWGPFDVILFNHVVEHVLDPVGVLARAKRFLAPGGRIVVKTPNARALSFLLFGTAWHALDAPRHVMLFDARTLRRLGERAGLELVGFHSRSSRAVWLMSRRIERLQGTTLPDGLEARRALLSRAKDQRPAYRLWRAFASPVARLSAAVGRGDTLEAHYAAQTASSALPRG